MPLVDINGVRLNVDDSGSGDPVVLVMGTGSSGRAWHLYQVPALHAAGFRTITFDARGIPPTDDYAGGFTIDDMVGDLAGLIEHVSAGPCRLVGTSMGAYVVQELALARPDLVRSAVLMATKGRTDTLRTALSLAELEFYDSGASWPPRYAAVVKAMQNLSPRTLNDDAKVRDWLELIELSAAPGPGLRAQLALDPIPDQLAALRAVRVPCQVIAFADDLLAAPHLGREVAEAIPGASFEVVPDCGHFGYLENPGAVNKIITEFFNSVPANTERGSES